MMEPAKSHVRSPLRPLLAQLGRILRFSRLSVSFSVVLLLVLTSVGSAVYTYTRTPTPAYAATSSTLNFQARLMTSAGNTVPDGYYNIQFNLYDVSAGGSTLWTETRDFAGTDDRVRIVNGFLSVNLGSVTSLPSTINWDQEHWLGMTIRGAATCDFATTCTPADSEMTPRLKLTAVPYAFRAGQADNVRSSNTNAASTNSAAITIQSGNAAGATSNSGNITLDVGTATGTTGTLSVGTANTSGITLGRVGITSILQGSLRFSSLNCTSNTNGGALTADVSGNISCTDDDSGGGGSGVTTVGAVDSQAKSANGAVISGVNIYLQTADATYPGLVSTGAQDFAGAKTFLSPLTVGNTSTLGTLSLHDGSGQKTVLQPGNSASDLTFILPTTVGASNECLKNSGTAGTLTFANCNNGSGAGGTITLQDAYDAGNTIATTDARNLLFTLANTATDANFIVNVAASSTGQFKIQNNGSDTLTITAAGTLSTPGNISTTGSGTITSSGLLTGVGVTAGTGLIQGTGGLTIGSSVAFTKGTDYSTTGSQNNVNFGAGALIRLTGASAQTITGITGGADGRILTLVNAAGQAAILTNLDGASSAANQITTGTGASLSVAAGASVKLVYDSTASLWRVVGGVAGDNGTCSTCANTALSNLGSVAINTALLANADNTIDLGSSSFSFRTLYADTSVLTPGVDTATAGALTIGNSAATSVSICNSAACDSVTIGNNADADTITVGDALDTFSLASTGLTVSTTGALSGVTGYSQTSGNHAITGAGTYQLDSSAFDVSTTGALSGITTIGLSSTISGGTTYTASVALQAPAVDTSAAGALTVGNSNATSVSICNSAACDTLTLGNNADADTITLGDSLDTFSLASTGLTVSTAGALSGITGYAQASGNFLQSGSGTFGTGTGAVSLNGATTVTGTNTFSVGTGLSSLGGNLDVTGSAAFKKGTDYSTTGTTNDVNLGEVSLVRLTGASAQTITGIANGRDGEILTLVNAAAQSATLSHLTGSAAANQINTGTGVNITIPAGSSITLIYDITATKWRVVGGVAGGNCASCATTSLNNLSSVAINTALLGNADNTIDLGSSAFSFRTLYTDTSVLTPTLDVAAAGALAIGNATATSVTLCNSAACDTVSIGTNADADAISVGDALDTITLTGTVGVIGTTSINASANFATNINTGTSTGAISIGNSVAGAVTIQNGTAGIAVTTAATTNNALTVTGSSLTTGTGLSVGSTSALMTSGNIASFNQTGSYTTPLAISGNVVNVNRAVAATVSAGAITLDSTNGNVNGNTPDLTWSHTVGSFSNRVLIVAVHMGGGDTVSSVTYGGVALNRIADAATDDASIWILVNPTVGTANVVVDNTAGSDPMAGRSSSWYNVDQATPTGTAATATGSSTTPSVVVTSAAGEVVVDSLMSDNVSNPTVGAGQTLLGTHFTGIKRFGTSYEAGAASTTMSWTASNGAWAIAGIPLKPSSASYTEIVGATQSISSSCTGTSCIDTSNVLSVSQLFGGATGAAVSIQNAGSGADIQLGNGLIQTANKTATSTNSTNVTIKTGNATGTTSNSGNISIDVGTATQTAGTISVGAANTSAITIGRSTVTTTINGNFAHSGTGTFGTGTGVVSLNGNTNVAATASLATMRGADYTTAGSANNVALNVASLYRLDTAGAAQTITGIAAGRDGQTLTLVNADAALAVTLSNLSGSSLAANQITTGTGADLSLSAGASADLIYDAGASLWRVVGGVAGGAGTCPTCANTALSNIASTNISAALNRTSGNLALQTTTSGDITLTTAAAAGLVNVLTGNLKVGDAVPTVSLNGEDAYIEGTLEVDGTSRFDAQLVVTSGGIDVTGVSAIDGGQIDLNASSNFATNINTGTSTGLVTIGGGNGTFSLQTTNIDISSAGVLSGITGYSQATGGFTYGTASDFSINLSGTNDFWIQDAGSTVFTVTDNGSLDLDPVDTTAIIQLGSTSQTGGITLGRSTASNTINIGNANILTGNTQTINIGAGTPAGTGKSVVTIGNSVAASSITLQAGSGGINLNGSTVDSNAATLALFGTPTTINIGAAVGAGGINLAGGSGSTGCTIDGSNGNLTCAGTITGGAAVTLQGAYDNDAGAPATITTTDADGDIQFILANTTTDANLLVNVASGSTSKFAVQKNSVDTFAVDANGFLTVQSSAALTNGQTAVTQTANVTSTSGGTMRGYQLNQTITSTTSAGTNIGHEINQTDNATALANTNTGLKVTLAGSNNADSQYGVDVSVNSGFALRATTSGDSNSLTCGPFSGGISVAVCADNTSNSTSGAGLVARHAGGGTTVTATSGSAVYGVSNSAGVVSQFYKGVKGEALQTAAAAYTSTGVYGTADAGAGATMYGGYFYVGGAANGSTLGSAIYGSNAASSVNILQLQDNTTDVFTVANGGAVTAKNQTDSTAAFQIQNAAGTNILLTDTTNQRISIGAVGGFSDTPTKLSNPASLPPDYGSGSSFSPDGTYMAVAHNTSPYVTIYKRSGDTFTKLADPASLPAGAGYSTSFSPDGSYMAVSHTTTPFVTIYKITAATDTFTKLANPASLPAGNGRGLTFSPDGQYMTVGHGTTPFVTTYKITVATDTFTKLTDPTTLPAADVYGVSYSPDSQYMAVAHSTSPYVTIYKRSGDTFTKLTNPGTLPTGTGSDVSFSPNGVYLAVSHLGSPNVTIYKRSGDTFTKLTNPGTLPAGNGEGVRWSPDSNYMIVASGSSPYINVYKRSGDTFTKQTNPGTLPAGAAESVGVSPDGTYTVIGHATTPFITIYKGSGIANNRVELAVGTLPSEGLSFGKELQLYRSTPNTLSLASGGNLSLDGGNLRVQGEGYFSGNVGINNTSPSYRLSVVHDNPSGAVASVFNSSTFDGGTNVGLRVSLGVAATTTNARFIQFHAGSTADNNGTGVGRIRLNNNNVAYETGAADFAEWFDVSESVAVGEIVAYNQNGTLSKAQAGSPAIVGVVSNTYGFTGGYREGDEDDPGRAAIGLTGQIKVKVTGAAISVGDPIGISMTAGIGQKQAVAGYIVGYAQESFSGSGTGTIMVYLNQGYYAGPTEASFLQNGGNGTLANLSVTGSADVAALNVSGATTLTNLIVTGDATVEGKLTVESIEVGTIKVNGHIITAGDTPVGQVLGASGTGASYVIDGNDTAGTLTITTGSTAISAGDLVKITFYAPFGKVPKIVLSAQDEPTNSAKIFPTSKTLTDYTLKTSLILPANTTYTFDYFIIE